MRERLAIHGYSRLFPCQAHQETYAIMRCIALEKASQCASCGQHPSQGDTGIRWKFPMSPWCRYTLKSSEATVKGQSRSDSLLLSPYHWAKLFRGVVAIVAVPMRFAVIC